MTQGDTADYVRSQGEQPCVRCGAFRDTIVMLCHACREDDAMQGDTGVQGDTDPQEQGDTPAPKHEGEFIRQMRKVTITVYAHEDELYDLYDTIDGWYSENEVALFGKRVTVEPATFDDLSLRDVRQAWSVMDPFSYAEARDTQ